MKQTTLIAVLFLLTKSVAGQGPQTLQDSIAVYFSEIEAAAKQHYQLWDKNLYGAMLLVDPQTRQVFANEPDTAGILKKNGDVYSGTLPDHINIANTALNWGGKRWAMIILPLSQDKQDRIGLLAHELFHKAQPSLGFSIHNARNNHLNQKDGRISLRLELEALKKAIQSSSKKEKHRHLTNALIFRKYRYAHYAGSDTTENLLELNEGIAEYTGLIVSGRNKKQAVEFLVNRIDTFFTFPTFVRSFANHTIPMYGYLLYPNHKSWNKEITMKTNLTDYFIGAFNVDLPGNLQKAVEGASGSYNGETILAEEEAREEATKKLIAEYRNKFIEQPHFEIQLEDMNISFNPSTLLPIEDKGTVFQSIRVTDLWGILTVEGAALMSPGWDKISVTNPTVMEGKKVTGDGWTLELTDGYLVEKDGATGNYKLRNTSH